MKKNDVTTIVNEIPKVDVFKEKLATFKQKVLEAKQSLKVAEEDLDAVKKLCPHDIIEAELGSAKCVICGESLGWFCPNSQDHVCHYWWEVDMQKNTVELVNGRTAHVGVIEPDDYGENCIFCGEPEERNK